MQFSQPQRRARRGIVFEVRAGGTPKYSGIVTRYSYLPGSEKCKIGIALEAGNESTAPIIPKPPSPQRGRGRLFFSKKNRGRTRNLKSAAPIPSHVVHFYIGRCVFLGVVAIRLHALRASLMQGKAPHMQPFSAAPPISLFALYP